MVSARGIGAECAFREGEVVAGRYRLGRSLGSGGMGVVMAATHVELGTPVALKFLHRTDGGAVERFVREARAAGRIEDDHVARVLDVGEAANGAPFIVMEYLEGEPLDAIASSVGRLSVGNVAALALQACRGLGAAHALGIVHRDVKPANLFVTRRADGLPLVKLLDFGISKVLVSEDVQLTTSESFLGSPSYASPEQLLAPRTVDARSDIWSLGVTMYRLVSGRLPFEGETVPMLTMQVLGATPERLDAGRSDVPPAFAEIVARCLEKEPAARFANTDELAHALAPFAGDAAAVLALPRAPASIAPAVVAPAPPRRRSLRLVAAFAALGAIAVPAIVVVTRPRSTPAPAAAAVDVVAQSASAAPLLASAPPPTAPELATAPPVATSAANHAATRAPARRAVGAKSSKGDPWGYR